MAPNDAIVLVVDDDPRVREALSDLLTAIELEIRTFASAAEYLGFARPDRPACLVLDVRLPDIDGLALQEQLAHREHPPIVFITGHGDIPSSVRAIKAGAIDFLPKPFTEAALLQAINAALDADRVSRLKRRELSELRRRYETLTPREREVLPLVVSGLLNKQAAARLGISKMTLQIHRRRIVHKMGVSSVAELVRATLRLSPQDLRTVPLAPGVRS